MTDKQKFCMNIKKLRENHKLSKKEMAEKLEVSVWTLNQIEKGILPKRLTIKIVYTIIDVFDVKPKDLFE